MRDPDRLIHLTYPTELNPRGESFSYPLFTRLREAARAHVALFGVEQARRRRAIFHDAPAQEEKVLAQHVSGISFEILRVGATTGRVLTAADDAAPGAHPVAVLSHALWTRRFGQDPSVVGRWFALEGQQLQIVGVAAQRFTGIEPGLSTDVWLPTAMRARSSLQTPHRTGSGFWDGCRTGFGPNRHRRVRLSSRYCPMPA